MDYAPIQLAVWDKSFVFQGYVAAPNSVTVHTRFNAAGDCTFEVDADHPRIPALTAAGARVVVTYQFREFHRAYGFGEGVFGGGGFGGVGYLASPQVTLMSGTVSEIAGDGAAFESKRTFTVRDDFMLFTDLIGVPDPAHPVESQASSYLNRRGSAEYVVKSVMRDTADFYGVPITWDENQSRGGTMSVQIRFAPLSDSFFPAVTNANLGIRIVQVDDALQMQTYVPAVYPRTLTEGSGIIQNGSFTIQAPTVTRVIVCADGEGKDRDSRMYVDSDLESEWGIVRVGYVDARDLQEGDDGLTPEEKTEQMQDRADEALAEGAPKVGLNVTLSETSSFQFSTTYGVGDQVSVQLEGAPLFTDTINEVELSWTPEDGLLITPLVGAWDDSADAKLIDVVSKAAGGVRALQRSL